MEGTAEKKSLTNRTTKLMLGVWAVGIVVAFFLTLYVKPWSTDLLGMAWSPQRALTIVAYSVLIWLPGYATALQIWRLHPEWNAPRGRYIPGKKYPFFSARNIAAIALTGAFTTAIGFASYGPIDLAAFIAYFSAYYFGPIAAGFGLSIMDLLGCSLWWGCGPIVTVAAVIIDGGGWAMSAICAWMILEPARAKGKISIPRYAAAAAAVYACQRLWQIYVLTMIPAPEVWVNITTTAINYYGTSPIMCVIALIITEAIIRVELARVKKRQ